MHHTSQTSASISVLCQIHCMQELDCHWLRWCPTMGAQLQHEHINTWANRAVKFGNSGTYHIENTFSYTCQGFTGRTPARVRDRSLPKGLNEYLAQLPRLGQLRTHVGSKSLVMQDYRWLPRLITAPEYFGNLQREMSQVATRTFNVLYYFPFIWFNGSDYPRSYI